jgi:ABC-type antimicrobial peptide transport system permease subunit
VTALVLTEGVQLAAVGIGIGLLASWGLLRVLRSQLYGISPTNLGVTSLAVLVLSGVAFLACYLPARRAAKVDPMVALRCE